MSRRIQKTMELYTNPHPFGSEACIDWTNPHTEGFMSEVYLPQQPALGGLDNAGQVRTLRARFGKRWHRRQGWHYWLADLWSYLAGKGCPIDPVQGRMRADATRQDIRQVKQVMAHLARCLTRYADQFPKGPAHWFYNQEAVMLGNLASAWELSGLLDGQDVAKEARLECLSDSQDWTAVAGTPNPAEYEFDAPPPDRLARVFRPLSRYPALSASMARLTLICQDVMYWRAKRAAAWEELQDCIEQAKRITE